MIKIKTHHFLNYFFYTVPLSILEGLFISAAIIWWNYYPPMCILSPLHIRWCHVVASNGPCWESLPLRNQRAPQGCPHPDPASCRAVASTPLMCAAMNPSSEPCLTMGIKPSNEDSALECMWKILGTSAQPSLIPEKEKVP